MPVSPLQQYELFRSMLEGRQDLTTASRVFSAVVDWLKLPLDIPEFNKTHIKEIVCKTFSITEEDLRSELLKASRSEQQSAEVQRSHVAEAIDFVAKAYEEEQDLRKLLPSYGFFNDYADYTNNSEAPLAFHVFCALAGLVATVNRRVHFDMGSFKLYPPLGVLILGPSGIKKTSAADIVVGLLNEMQLTPVYAEKLSPEALVDAMKGGNATGIVYAPEMTVLISKQKYMESIIPLLTRFMDSPDIWKSETIMRGKGVLTDVAITCLMCSTLDWFIKNTPETVFGGGFIARNIMILQETSSRMIALPSSSNQKLRERLIIELATMHEFNGKMTLTEKANKTYVDWYEYDKRYRQIDYEILETYYQRKPSHLLRFAMCLHLTTCQDLEICVTCFERALKILEWTERFLPLLAGKMFKSSWGEDQDTIVRKIRSNGGTIFHSELVRKMQYRMSASVTRSIISSLKEGGVVAEVHNATEHYYILTEKANG